MTLEEVKEKYSDRFRKAYGDIRDASMVISVKCAKNIVDHATGKMAKLLDEIAMDGYRVIMFTSALCGDARGFCFVPLSEEEKRIFDEKLKERGNGIHEGSDS